MAGRMIDIKLFIPEGVFTKIPLERKQAFANEVRALKALSIKLNEGRVDEEMTVKATMRLCYHDEVGVNKPDEPDQEI